MPHSAEQDEVVELGSPPSAQWRREPALDHDAALFVDVEAITVLAIGGGVLLAAIDLAELASWNLSNSTCSNFIRG